VAALLALASSALWGTGDFLGGTLSRRLHPARVMRITQLLALGGLLAIAAVAGELDAPISYLGWGLAAGAAGTVALGSFYAALANGTMGVVAPVAACGVIVPVGIGLAGGESPSGLQLVGIVVAVVGVVLASGPESRGTTAGRDVRPLLLAAVAAAGFGSVLVLVAEGSEHSVVMTLATMRAVNVVISTVVLVLVVDTSRATRADGLPLVTIAATDTSANGLYALATQSALVSVSAVLASLYPAATAVLAWRFHGERLRRPQVVGVALTLAGVALIAGG